MRPLADKGAAFSGLKSLTYTTSLIEVPLSCVASRSWGYCNEKKSLEMTPFFQTDSFFSESQFRAGHDRGVKVLRRAWKN